MGQQLGFANVTKYDCWNSGWEMQILMPSFSIVLGKVLRHSAMFCFRTESIERCVIPPRTNHELGIGSGFIACPLRIHDIMNIFYQIFYIKSISYRWLQWIILFAFSNRTLHSAVNKLYALSSIENPKRWNMTVFNAFVL